MIDPPFPQGAAIVTGAARGIGRAIVERLSNDGWEVAGLDEHGGALAAARTERPGVEWVSCNVACSSAVREAVALVRKRFGFVGLLVNNAGIAGPTALTEDVTDDDWDRTININLNGAFRMIRAVVPEMKSAGHGAIVNIITTSVKTGLPHRLPYIASKGGLLAMMETLARELGPFNVRCNSVSPGMVDNERGRRVLADQAQLAGQSLEAFEEEARRFISMRCWIAEEEIAAAVAFLASSQARHVTNQHLSVCGNSEWE